MKKYLFVSLLMLGLSTLFVSCKEEDEFYRRNVTASELESGTATFLQSLGSKKWFFYFKDGYFGYSYFKGKDCVTMSYNYKYTLNGSTLTLNKEGMKCALTLELIHWGNGGGEQLRLVSKDDGSLPHDLEEGYYDKYTAESLAEFAFVERY